MKLALGERLRLAWELTWPLTLLDLALIVLVHGMFDVQSEAIDLVWGVFAFFGLTPWIMRRAFERFSPGKHVVAVSQGVEAPRLSYQQTLKAMWLLAWRTTPLALLALLLLSLFFRTTGISLPKVSAGDPLVNAFGLSMLDTITALVLYPLLIPGMLKKRYRGFHLEARPATARKV